jgi:hypothetical protein
VIDAVSIVPLSRGQRLRGRERYGKRCVNSNPERELHVAVLGAAGTIAPAIIHDLAESEEVESMALLDLDSGKAAAVAQAHGGGKATAAATDAREVGALAGALRGVDVLLNTASYRVNLEAMQACLQAGCHYLDLGGLYWMTRRQLALGPEFERAGRLAVLGIGSSPGKTNLMAAEAAPAARLRSRGDRLDRGVRGRARPRGPERRSPPPAVRGPDAARRADARAGRAAGRAAGADRAALAGWHGQLRRPDR